MELLNLFSHQYYKRMLQGKVYMLSSPNYPKAYIGSTIQSMNRRLNRHRGKWNSCRSRELFQACPDSIEVKILEEVEVKDRKELQHHEVRDLKEYRGMLVNRNMPYRDRKQRYQDNIVQEREYQRNRYATETKKNGGSGEYRQLQYYNDRKDTILRRTALLNAWKHKRLPFKSTMIKHNITEEDVASFMDEMRNP